MACGTHGLNIRNSTVRVAVSILVVHKKTNVPTQRVRFSAGAEKGLTLRESKGIPRIRRNNESNAYSF